MRKPYIENIKYSLIEMLSGDMPIVLNMIINRPIDFKGALVHFPCPEKPGLFSKNYLKVISEKEPDAILLPRRDYELEDSNG